VGREVGIEVGTFEHVFQPRAACDGLDPLPGYIPPSEVSTPGNGAPPRYPLALVSPASPYFLNSMFPSHPELARRAGPPTVVLHPDDAAAHLTETGQRVRVRNDRGAFVAIAQVGDAVRRGVVATTKGHWPKLLGEQATVNATVAERDSDMGGGAVYHDNAVEIEPIHT
jgi:anaerobic selenocysteine-containing dehydrogenase